MRQHSMRALGLWMGKLQLGLHLVGRLPAAASAAARGERDRGGGARDQADHDAPPRVARRVVRSVQGAAAHEALDQVPHLDRRDEVHGLVEGDGAGGALAGKDALEGAYGRVGATAR